MTVSGVLSMCSIRSQFNTIELWFKRVTGIIAFFAFPSHRRNSREFEGTVHRAHRGNLFSRFRRAPPDKRVGMPENKSTPVVPAAMLARMILDVCITNDDAGIETELKRILRQAPPATRGIESERQELLRAIAEGISRERKTRRGGMRGPRFGVWVNLLRHLSV